MTRKRIAAIAAGIIAIAVAAAITYGVTRPTYDLLAGGPRPAVGLYWYDNANPTAPPGMTAPNDQLLVRTDVPSIYYKSGTSSEAWTLIGQASGGGGGTVSSVACGTGLSCTPSPITATGTVNVSLTTTTCPAGQAEIATAADGTSTCAAFAPATSVAGTTNTLAMFTSASAIGDSPILYNGSTTLSTSKSVFISGDEAPGDGLAIANLDTARIINFYGINSVVGGSSDATALPRSNYGIYAQASATRSAGANVVTNYGVYGTAVGAQNNFSGFFDLGTFQVNGQSLFVGEMFLLGATALRLFGSLDATGQNIDAANQITMATAVIGTQIESSGTPTVNFGSFTTGSTNFSGDVTSIGAHTAVILTYSSAFPNRSRCTANPISISVTVETIVPVAVAGSVTFNCYSVAAAPILTNCDDFTYNCIGQ